MSTSRLMTCSALTLMLATSAVQADLKSDDVWTDWKSYMRGLGYDISGLERQTGAGITVEGMAMRFPFPEDEGDITLNVGDVSFVELGDGTVRVDLPSQWSFDFKVTPEDAETVTGKILYDQTEPNLIVSGTTEAMNYAYSASTVAISMNGLTVDGVALGPDILAMAMQMENVSSQTSTTTSDPREYGQAMTAENVSYTVNFSEPDGDGRMKVNGAAQSIEITGQGLLPMQVDPYDVSAMIEKGFAVTTAYRFVGGSNETTIRSDEGSATTNSTSASGTFGVSMSEQGLSFEAVQEGLDANMLISEFPLPISYAASEARVNLGIPLVKADQPQDFALGMRFADLTISDGIWGIFDPTAQLPRDPATLVLDLTGQATVLFDFLDPDQAAILEQSGATPGEINALNLNSLVLDMVGARLTGEGSATFDNSDLTTIPGMPRPTGSINLELTGGNTLLDKLVAMGLLPQDQAMGARMMMGLFARPGPGEDTLVSTIEINEEGHVLANGQRIQ